MSAPFSAYDATGLAAAVRARKISAKEVATGVIQAIRQRAPILNCFTAVLEASALSEAELVDRRLAAGEDPGVLAGVPFAVKNLFDVAGLKTIAGSKIHADNAPAEKDATAVSRMKNAGAVLVGALNMDEYAYGFTTENIHYGPTRNPHDLERMAGGSSGGSAAAVAGGLVPLTLGTDTNGSIRVPAAFCGIFGLKPTYGRISRAGVVPLAESFDHVGSFARSVRDLALSLDVMHGADPRDPVCSGRPLESTASALKEGVGDLRIAMVDDAYFHQGDAEAFATVVKAAEALGVTRAVTIPGVEPARAAAYLITACESAALHRPNLRTRPLDFDPIVLERLLAGSLFPASWYPRAQRFRSVFRDRMRKLFDTVDVILAPATPCPAIRISDKGAVIAGTSLPARPNLGMFTQPFSFIGLPIVCVPVFASGSLPLGVQVVGPAYREDWVLRVAQRLEQMGVACAHPPALEKIA